MLYVACCIAISSVYSPERTHGLAGRAMQSLPHTVSTCGASPLPAGRRVPHLSAHRCPQVTFLKKLSIFSENITQMKENGIVAKLNRYIVLHCVYSYQAHWYTNLQDLRAVCCGSHCSGSLCRVPYGQLVCRMVSSCATGSSGSLGAGS